MKFSFSFALALSLISTSVNAFVIRDPPVEATAVRHGHAISIPKPTAAPAEIELRRRQAASQRTLLGAGDNTCGFLHGDTSQPWGCTAGADCFFATATPLPANSTQTQTAGSVLCCDLKTGCPSAPAPTACVDRGQNDYNKTCTGACPTDPMTLKCTSGIYLFCNTLVFPTPSISALFCNYLSTYDALPAVTAHAFTPTIVAFAVSTTPSSTLPTTATSHSSPSSATPTSALSSSGSKSSPNEGKIIGGVLGGVAGLVLIAGLVILFLRWRNGREEEPEPVKEEAPVKEDKGKAVGKISTSTSEEVVGAAKPASDAGRSQKWSSRRNSAMAGSNSNKGSGKRVRVVG
ncbi:uncharacterized protein PAC_03810 [Phialocephala subalpina]|uniref:Uncharacterized protein n=1 Tax=Phialocephala subalpina TaxID=576137 RepID=A0A1L7WMD7_9HELO|nr:uncharacterized protein PAC_03810 [Phialocephala subalpina]